MRKTIQYMLPMYGDVFETTKGSTEEKAKAKELASELNYLLDINRLNVRISSISDTPIATKIWVENDLPSFDGTLQKAKKMLQDINMRFEYPIEIGTETSHKGFYFLFSKNKEQRPIIRLGDLIRTDLFLNKFGDSPTKVVLGINDEGVPVVLDISQFPHGLISGITGSGKSTCMNTIISCLISCAAPSKVGIVLIDPKATELEKFKMARHNLFSNKVMCSSYDIKNTLWRLETIRRDRQNLFASKGVADLKLYNALEGVEKLAPIVVFIDEIGQVVTDVSSRDALHRLASLSRTAGIHLICAVQKPSAKILPTEFRDNLGIKLAFKAANKSASRVALDEAGAEKLLGKGDGLYYDTESCSYRNFQCAYVSDEEIKKCIEFSNNQFIGV